ncbi:uncharacterized protein LOC114939632, partial [Nylanderia fulva]|uniref:uncharacterized protein LOC114939632 n=1 Tax=Nylanderia fulva TaxID=613905 RepID=UPI0010FAD914
MPKEIIGYVDGIEASRSVGNNKQYKFFKFYLNNGNGKRIQIVAWNVNIDLVENYIQTNRIIYLDGVQAKPPKVALYNNVLEGYIKTNLSSIHNNKLNKIIGCGSLTDGVYKLEVHIVNFVEDDYYEMDIRKGDKIEIIGVMSNTG